MPLAVAAAARVVDEHAVAVAHEHLRVAQRAAAVAAAAGDHEHGGAVLGRAVPALEIDAVGGREADGLVVGARRVPTARGIEWMSTIAIPTGPKKNITASTNTDRTSTRMAQRRTGPSRPGHAGGMGSRRRGRPARRRRPAPDPGHVMTASRLRR